MSQSPPVRDSDIIYLCIRQLERVAERMSRKDYGPELEADMARAAEWFEWAAASWGEHKDGKESVDDPA